ncbi:MAG: hypothetical protein K2X99_03070 [Gemmatimonadaceae bacterium]|nr:hypothetical protein [Gemmatimonadaceae bacterium]
MSTPARSDRAALTGVLVLAVLLALPALGHGFTYDDRWIIVENPRVHSLTEWWRVFVEPYWPNRRDPSLYRPLTTLGFAVQWALGGGAPWVFHLISLGAYVAACGALWYALRAIASTDVALLGALLFAAHPVHVEAVANVVGQSELIAAALGLAALGRWWRVRAVAAPSTVQIVGILALFAAAVLVKEHLVVLPAIALAAEWVLPASRPRERNDRVVLIGFAVVAGAFVALRTGVLGSLGGDVPHPALMRRSLAERQWITLALWPEKLRLLLWPSRLLPDYSPPDLPVRAAASAFHAVAAVIPISVIGLIAGSRRRAPLLAFSLIATLLALAPSSNGVVVTSLVAERALFLPSAFVCLAFALGLHGVGRRWPRYAMIARMGAIVLLALGSWRSIRRTADWRDDATLFARYREDAPRSFRAHAMWSGWLYDARRFDEADAEMQTAIALYPEYAGSWERLGLQRATRGHCDAALPPLREALQRERPRTFASLARIDCALATARFAEARDEATAAIASGIAVDRFAARRDSALRALAVPR